MKCSDIPDEEIMEACQRFHDNVRRGYEARTPEQSLADKYPPKLILVKMEKMVRKGLLEYGVSLRTAWVKKKEGK